MRLNAIALVCSVSAGTLTAALQIRLPPAVAGNRTFEAVTGFFAQDNPVAIGIPAVPPRFGLLDDSPSRWSTLFDHVARLNQEGVMNKTSYKVLFLGRHGQGYHNLAEAKYGTQAWDDYWSKLNGDGEITWGPDPELTPLGESQATAAREAWEAEIPVGLPFPGQLYISPFTRAMKTYELTFDGILPPASHPIVLENCREVNGVHTCDKRRTRSYITSTFPTFEIEKGFTEEDLLWDPDVRETDAHVIERATKVLNIIFDNPEPFVSVTGHGGIINGFMGAIGRPKYSLPTGGVLPVVVKSVYTHITKS